VCRKCTVHLTRKSFTTVPPSEEAIGALAAVISRDLRTRPPPTKSSRPKMVCAAAPHTLHLASLKEVCSERYLNLNGVRASSLQLVISRATQDRRGTLPCYIY
jgi:hypothetical protein